MSYELCLHELRVWQTPFGFTMPLLRLSNASALPSMCDRVQQLASDEPEGALFHTLHSALDSLQTQDWSHVAVGMDPNSKGISDLMAISLAISQHLQ